MLFRSSVRSRRRSDDSALMPYESDADDAVLLDAGNIAALLARYHDQIVGRCVARLRGHADAEDVAQDAKLRLLAEFRRGKRYGGARVRPEQASKSHKAVTHLCAFVWRSSTGARVTEMTAESQSPKLARSRRAEPGDHGFLAGLRHGRRGRAHSRR